MRAIWTIAWREFRVLVTSPLFFGISGLCAVFWTYKFLRDLQQFAMMAQRPNMAEHANIQYTVFMQHLSVVNLVLLFIVPMLTMRLLAEEKKQKTYDLLLTSPITSTQIAVGKFLGGYMVALALIAIGFIYPLGTGLIADFQWAPLFSAFIGLAAVVGGYVAIGVFSSSVTQSPLMSAGMALILILFIWFLGMGHSEPYFRGPAVLSFCTRGLPAQFDCLFLKSYGSLCLSDRPCG